MILHRDLKLENVLLTEAPRSRQRMIYPAPKAEAAAAAAAGNAVGGGGGIRRSKAEAATAARRPGRARLRTEAEQQAPERKAQHQLPPEEHQRHQRRLRRRVGNGGRSGPVLLGTQTVHLGRRPGTSPEKG